jgi:1-deoxy-D-xylulose-5-phosphate reductoisomerase
MPTALAAASDVVVAAFIAGKIPFYKIPDLIEKTLEKHRLNSNPSLDEIMEADRWSRDLTSKNINKL